MTDKIISRTRNRNAMTLIDLSREITHRMQGFPTHPPVIVSAFGRHDDERETFGLKYSSATMYLSMGDHAGTHVDAPCHFNADPTGRDRVFEERFQALKPGCA